jgi:hypothetical protein
MDKFKIGDLVVVIKPQDSLAWDGIGLMGTVVKVTTSVAGNRIYGVKFSKHRKCFHNLSGSLSEPIGYYFLEPNIEFASVPITIDSLL